MKPKLILPTVLACLLLSGCASRTRSISQSGYQEGRRYCNEPVRELDEFDVLGLDRLKPVTEEEIQRASKENKPVQLNAGSAILLVQSGSAYPDGPMVTELGKHFRIVPFTGVAPEKPSQRTSPAQEQSTRNVTAITDPDAAAYSRTLRLAAARAGASTVVCYWGILESGTEQFATKTVSWLPVVNWVMPDERQHMRLRMKIAMVDVATGSWSVFSAEPLESTSWSVRPRREVADQKQVESIKKKAYEMAAQGLVNAYTKPL